MTTQLEPITSAFPPYFTESSCFKCGLGGGVWASTVSAVHVASSGILICGEVKSSRLGPQIMSGTMRWLSVGRRRAKGLCPARLRCALNLYVDNSREVFLVTCMYPSLSTAMKVNASGFDRETEVNRVLRSVLYRGCGTHACRLTGIPSHLHDDYLIDFESAINTRRGPTCTAFSEHTHPTPPQNVSSGPCPPC